MYQFKFWTLERLESPRYQDKEKKLHENSMFKRDMKLLSKVFHDVYDCTFISL